MGLWCTQTALQQQQCRHTLALKRGSMDKGLHVLFKVFHMLHVNRGNLLYMYTPKVKLLYSEQPLMLIPIVGNSHLVRALAKLFGW